MLRIGDFSILSRIGIRTLRYYDNFGVLRPAFTDDATNYRYYIEEQLVLANRIEALRGMGMSLGDIKQLLDKCTNVDDLKDFLISEYSNKLKEISNLQEQTNRLFTAIKHFESDTNHYICNIVIKNLESKKVASLRKTIPTYINEFDLWQKINEECQRQNVRFDSPAYNTAIYHDNEYRESNIDVEIQRGIIGDYLDTDLIKFKNVPGKLVASITIKGDDFYQEVNNAVAKWLVENRFEFDGPMQSIYHVSPKLGENSSDRVTEVCFPIKSSI